MLTLLTLTINAMLLVLVITQIITPLCTGKKLFPIFNKKRNKILSEIKEVEDDIELNRLSTQLHNLKQQSENSGIQNASPSANTQGETHES